MPFGQLVIGPPGSGKTTYCNGMQQFMQAAGRKVAIINLDPANDLLPYTPAVDIAELVALEEVMEEFKLGPNGGLVYCIDYLEKNMDWLKEQLAPLEKDGYYFLFDCPGQVELFMMHDSLRAVVNTLTGSMAYRLTAVHLVDAHLCTDATKFISALLLSLSSMLHLEMPHINVLSKIDLVKHYGKLAFNLDYFTEVQDLSHLLNTLGSSNDAFSRRNRKLSRGLCELVEDFGLVSFVPLAIQDKASVQRLLAQVDKANGHVYAAMSTAGHNPYPAEFLYGSAAQGLGTDKDMWMSYQEMYLEQEVTERDVTRAGSAPPGLAGAQPGVSSEKPASAVKSHAGSANTAAAAGTSVVGSRPNSTAAAAVGMSGAGSGSYVVEEKPIAAESSTAGGSSSSKQAGDAGGSKSTARARHGLEIDEANVQGSTNLDTQETDATGQTLRPRADDSRQDGLR